jgi:hypothetical protein
MDKLAPLPFVDAPSVAEAFRVGVRDGDKKSDKEDLPESAVPTDPMDLNEVGALGGGGGPDGLVILLLPCRLDLLFRGCRGQNGRSEKCAASQIWISFFIYLSFNSSQDKDRGITLLCPSKV